MNLRILRSRTHAPAALICTALACGALLAAAGSAGAVVVQTGGGHFLGIAPKKAGLTPALQTLRVGPRATPTATPAPRAGASPRASNTAGLPPNKYDNVFGQGFVDTSAYPNDGGAGAGGGNPSGCISPSTVPVGDPSYVHCLTDAQIQAEVNSVIAAHSLPTNGSAIYFVMLPPGIDECFAAGAESSTNACADLDFCAYHSSEGTSSGPLYAVQPYAHIQGCMSGQSPNSNAKADDLVNVLSHEHNETVSDPFGTGWVSAKGNEIGDLCAAPDVFGAPVTGSPATATGSAYNQIIDGANYWLQDEYADTDGANLAFDGCQQRPGGANDGFAIPNPPATPDPGPLLYQGGNVVGHHTTYTIYWGPSSGANAFPTGYQTAIDTYLTHVGAESQKVPASRTDHNVYDVTAQYGTPTQPTASFTAPASAKAGQPVTFDASASNDPTSTTPTYTWDFGDGSSTATGQPTVTHAYSATGSHIVTLIVSDQFGGTSQPATRTIHILVSPTASFSVPPGPLHSGQPITFDGSASGGPDAPVTSFSWTFGDGGTATGARPSHVYLASSVYTVTLTVTDANGNTGTSTQQATVVEPTNPPSNNNPNNNANRNPSAQIASSGATAASLVNGSVVVLTGRVIRCPAGTATCRTTVKLTTRVAGRSVRGRRSRLRTVTIGTGTINTSAGRSSVVSVKLNAQGRSLLRRLRHLTVTARISTSATGVQGATATVTFGISQPASRRRRR